MRRRFNVHGNVTKLLQNFFKPHIMIKFQQLYRLAVYQHRAEGVLSQCASVMSVLFHEMDHRETSTEQKEYYHRFCGGNPECDFISWIRAGKTADTFTKTKFTPLGKEVDWDGAEWAGMDTIYPDAFEEFVGIVDHLGREDLMSRCTTLRTSNAMSHSMPSCLE